MSFGPLLRSARTTRRLTQEQLAEDAEISTRHLSYLEGGKAKPSREMVLVLASALDLPLRERNLMLNAAGFVAAYGASSMDAESFAPIRAALTTMLGHHEPYPALVFDRAWNVVMTNHGAAGLMRLLLPTPTANMVRAIFDPASVRPYIVNWNEVASYALEHLERDAAHYPHDTELKAVLELARSFPEPPPKHITPTQLAPFVATHFRKDGLDLKLFTTLTTLGTPLDVTAQELRIESYYPVDDATAAFFRDAASN